MPRPYSDKFLSSLSTADATQVGVQLGRLCVDGNLPASYIAIALGATRMSVYNWFRGQDIRRKKRKEIEALVSVLRQDFREGKLPAETRQKAREYVEELIGMPLEKANITQETIVE